VCTCYSGQFGKPHEQGCAALTPATPTDQSSTDGQQDSTKTQEPLWCKATDHDLTTNRPLRCDRDYHRDVAHHWVFADAPGTKTQEGDRG
jgi:hypothetical protein